LEPSLKTIGRDQVAVPKQFTKLFYSKNSQYKMIAFLIPNKSSEQPLFNYVVSVDLIEQKTGIDFSCTRGQY
jgi:endonuclease G